MRSGERFRGLVRAPRLTWDALVRGKYSFVYDQMPVDASGMSVAKRINLFKAGANLLHRRLNPWSMPLHMQFELTNFCNLRCPVCPTGIGAVGRKPQAMDVGLFSRVIDEVGPYLLTASLWAWGEPLLHPRLREILRAVRRYPIATLLSTNGQNLDDDPIIDTLTEEPPTYLIVALDGLTDETNSRFRVGARLAPALEGVRRMAEIKKKRGTQLPVLHMRTIVMKHNQHEVPGLVEFARRHHFDLLSVRTLSTIDSAGAEGTHDDLVPDAPEHRAYDYQDGARVGRTDFICQEPFWFPTVLADGTLVACEQDYNAQQSLGAISETVSFKDLWRAARAARVRRIIRDAPQSLSFCRNCPYKDRPVTDCSVRAHFLNSGIDYPKLVSR
ncbi:MAG: radical SAM protein [Deferrisomatales bacterium]|nr:radical SAM protein [Deferrisomatales bacterium]